MYDQNTTLFPIDRFYNVFLVCLLSCTSRAVVDISLESGMLVFEQGHLSS